MRAARLNTVVDPIATKAHCQAAKVIFVISLPRSGSTLLQHMLAAHTRIHSLPEPWFMLPFAYVTRESGVWAEFNADSARLALHEFLSRTPGGSAVLEAGIRGLAMHLYASALADTGKDHYVDKTPRYHLIIPELARIFPEASFVFLIRNPVAVLSSILNVNLGGDWWGLANPYRRLDLVAGPRDLVAGLEHLGDRAVTVGYEELVRHPERQLNKICAHVGLEFEPQMLEYGDKVAFRGSRFVDPKSIYRHGRAVPDYVDAWRSSLQAEPIATLARMYVESLGPRTFEQLGYSFTEVMGQLPSRPLLQGVLHGFWDPPATSPPRVGALRRRGLQVASSMQGMGVRQTLRRATRSMANAH